MKLRKKAAVVSIMAVIALSIILYVPMITATQSDGNTPENSELQRQLIKCKRCCYCCDCLWWILTHSEPVTVDGTVVGLVKAMLVLNVEDGQVRVLLPPIWTVGTEIVRRRGLFDTGFLSAGENVTIKALKTPLIDEEGYKVYLLFGYEMTNSTGARVFAVLPFNVED